MRAARLNNKGFTLIELIVVILILGILAATALPKLIDLGSDARLSILKGAKGSLSAANAMLYAKAASSGLTGTGLAAGCTTGAVWGAAAAVMPSVPVNNKTVCLNYGYAATLKDLLLATELKASTVAGTDQFGVSTTGITPDFGFTPGGTLWAWGTAGGTAGVPTVGTCFIIYTPAGGATTSPIYSDLPNSSDNC